LRIHTLEIGANNFDDDGIRILSSALIRLIYFGLRGDLNISASGWLDLSAIFSCPTCSIRRLWFRGTNISDDGVISFGNALAVNKTIISLDLRDSKTITLAGWRGIASCLRSRISTLEELNLRNCNIDEQSASEIVAALVGNKVLQRLDMLEDFENEMSEYEGFMSAIQDELISYAYMNDNENKAEVARQKTVKHHFSGGNTGIHALACMSVAFCN